MNQINNVIILNNDINPNDQANNQNEDNISYIQAVECRYIDSLAENDKIIYEKFLSKGCCGSGNNKMTITLLVYSIIIIIFTVTGFVFRISNNEGYKEYKAEIENALISVDTNLPDDSEMQKILNFTKLVKEFKQIYKDYSDSNYKTNEENYNDNYNYNKNRYISKEYKSYYGKNCSYELFRTGLCSWDSYKDYCDRDKFYDNQCNLVDYYFYSYR